jgi:hypothetical protein
MLFLATLSLLIGKLFKFTEFNGLIFWFILSNILIILFIIFYKNKVTSFILIDLKKIENPSEYLQYIFNYYIIFINKNYSRAEQIKFQSVIHSLEEECLDRDCPLKKYLSNEKDRLDTQYLLIKYCERLFQYGITKFSDDISIKSNYISFLLYSTHNRKKALLMLNDIIEEKKISFINYYIIHLCKKLIEKTDMQINKNENDYSMNIKWIYKI